jgi:DNA-directed RNA polymerase beta subunit
MTRDRLMEQSDEFRMWVCNTCGLPAHVEKEGFVRECKVCGTSKISKIRIPFGTKLISQELMVMGVTPRVMVHPFAAE